MDPIEGRKPRLERQTRLFHVKKQDMTKAKNLLGVTAWGRLMKNDHRRSTTPEPIISLSGHAGVYYVYIYH